MNIRNLLLSGVTSAAAVLLAAPAFSQVLYMDDFDVDSSASWTAQPGTGGTDTAFDFFFDYSSVGIPSAPNTTGGTTRGMKLQANQFSGIFGGFSVSPNGQSFTGDYKLTFDLWGNFIGPFPGGGSGTSQLSTFGVGTSGTVSNAPGTADAVYFATTLDGGSSADYRAYSPAKPASHQAPPVTPEDALAVYAAGGRNATEALYADNWGNSTVPAAQTALYPDTQSGQTNPGVMGMSWTEHEISKVGNTVTWSADGITLITVDISTMTLGGDNIMFGHSDINATSSTDFFAPELIFTLIDNVKVSAAAAAPDDADFDNDGDVDGADFLIWQKGLIADGSASNATGDANTDGDVDGDDLAIWKTEFGQPQSVANVGAVPEPATWALALVALVAAVAVARPGRILARVRA